MRILTVVGARPQFVKAATVSRAIAAREGITEVLVHTGQHYDQNMSDVFFDELEIPRPDVNLGIGGGTHGQQTGRMLAAIEQILLESPPDWVLVYGDTNSTLAGALAAVKLHIRLAHVEAGLRSYNRCMPEELNRVLTDHAADLLLAPTQTAVDNLAREGIGPDRVVRCGDVMQDAAIFYGSRAVGSDLLERLGLGPGGFVLATVHRAENTDDPARLAAIVEGLRQCARDLPVVLPLHPRTRQALAQHRIDVPDDGRLRLLDPVGYLDMVTLERHARLIATDSGGVQKEAYFQRVPCVTLRDETEWVELVALGWNRLVSPTDAAAVAQALADAMQLDTGNLPQEDLYGDGHAAAAIVQCLAERNDS